MMKKSKMLKSAILTAMACMVPAMAMAAPAMNNPEKNLDQVMPRPKTSLQNNFTGTKADNKLGSFILADIEVNLDESMTKKINVEDLTAMVPDYVEKKITMDDLNELMNKITMYCRSKGFAAATCYLPEQKAKYAVIHVDVVPGRYGEVRFENDSRLSNEMLAKYARKLQAGKVITTSDLEGVLRNISDVGGVELATGVLSPGAEVGTSDVTIHVNKAPESSSVVYVDNYGSKSSGRYRYGIQSSFYGLNHSGTSLKVGGMVSNSDQRNFYVSSETPVGNGDTVVGVGISHMNYELSGVAKTLGAKGDADTVSLYGKTTLVNTVNHNVKLNYGYDYRNMNDDLSNYTNADTEKHSNVIHAGIEGNFRVPGTYAQYDVTAYYGNFTADSFLANYMADQTGTQGNFTKGVANMKVMQALGHSTDVVFSGQAQVTNNNLDSSEKMFLGGANGVRAYPQGEASGDQGFLGTAELRYHTPVQGLTLSTYFDAGSVQNNHNGDGTNRNLRGWGLGMTYFKPNDWFARFDYARRIGGDNNISSDARAKGRMWFTMGKLF